MILLNEVLFPSQVEHGHAELRCRPNKYLFHICLPIHTSNTV